MKRNKLQPYLAFSFAGLLSGLAAGQVLITQYHEGRSNNKYLELTNTGDEAVDLSTYTLARFINDGAEDWKNDGVPNAIERLSGTLEAGASLVLANGGASVPYDADEANLISSIITFNGNDSMVLYEGLDEFDVPITTTAAIVDAFSVTVGANDISVLRKAQALGYNTSTGTTFADFPAVWETIDLETADMASLGEDAFLGSSALGKSLPVVGFSAASTTVSEDSGSVEITVEILNPDGQGVSVDVTLDTSLSTVSSAEVGGFATQTVTFPSTAASGDTRSITVNIANDNDEEPTEQAFFNLENIQTAGEAIVGGSNVFTLGILDDDIEIQPLYISEIADPSDAFSARFIEIFNPTETDIDLAAGNWNIIVYFNGNTSGQTIPLVGVISAGTTYVVANSETNFTTAYPDAGFPNQTSGSINSNGNETFELRFGGGADTGVLVDIYGIVGTNGEGQDFEFLDSQVERSVPGPSATFDVAQWTIKAATTAEMTPGVFGGGGPPVGVELEVLGFCVDAELGRGDLIVTGLGTKVWILQFSDDLGLTDVWEELPGGFSEIDNPDGSTTIQFFDAVSATSARYYRLIEQR